MALAFDAAASTDGGAVSSLTFSHTCSGNDRIIIVGVAAGDDDGRTVSSVTYAGVNLTQVRAQRLQTSGIPDKWVEMWYLVAPATGANNVVVTLSGAVSNWVAAGSISLTGAAQTGQPDASNDAVGTSTTASVSVTTVADNCWVIDVVSYEDLSPTLTVGAGQTERWIQNDASDLQGAGSTEGPKTPAGAVTMSWDGGNDDWAMMAVSVAPAAGEATVRSYLTTLGVS